MQPAFPPLPAQPLVPEAIAVAKEAAMGGPGTEPHSRKAACMKALGTGFFIPAVLFLTLNGLLNALAVDWRSRIQGRLLSRAAHSNAQEEGDVRYLYAALVLYVACAALMYWSYAKAVLSDPGVVPLDVGSAQRKWQALGSGAASEEAWSYCESCRRYRPPRAHHCHTCGICIFRLDHYSLWINNCVGKCNQRYFVQFLAYLALFLLSTGLGPWPGFTDDFAEQELDQRLGPLSSLRLPADYTHAICLVAFPGALGLLLAKLWMMNWGLTAQECTPWMASCCPAHVHDRGLCMNWVDVMGTSPMRWLLPLSPAQALLQPCLDARLTDSI